MPAFPHNDSTDLAIANAISAWLDTAPESDRISAEDLIARHPELAPGLEEALAGLSFVRIGATSILEDTCHDEIDADCEYPDIPDFDIVRELGRGGMGVVYEARQLSLDRVVALKVLPRVNVESKAAARFLREAETIASLQHPNIVPVYDAGVFQGLHWYSMQLIDGMPLSNWAEENRSITTRERCEKAVQFGFEIADALEHAHCNGVIHRDVKPGNLLVDRDGKCWLTDFGLARRDVDVTATATGAMLGTPRYMSCEQIGDQQHMVDRRTDIYSLGATLYELVTARPVFESESALTLLQQILSDAPIPPRKIQPQIARPLELVILKCLDKEALRRYQTAKQLGDDLRAIRDNQPIMARGLSAWVRGERFWRRNQCQISLLGRSVVLTIIALAFLSILVTQLQRSRQTKLRLSTPGGLYFASIQPTGTESQARKDTEPVLVTTPMQQSLQLRKGKYQVRFEGQGRPAETYQFDLQDSDESRFEYVDRRPDAAMIDIDQKLARVASDGALLVLDQDHLKAFDPDGSARFSIDLDDLGEDFDETIDSKNLTEKLFGYDSTLPFQGWQDGHHNAFANTQRLCPLPKDLDGDGQPDFIVTSGQFAAIAAISSLGDVIWKRKLEIDFEPNFSIQSRSRNEMPYEVITGIDLLDSQTHAGNDCLVVTAAVVDPQGYCRPVCITLDAKDGDTVYRNDFPTINMRTKRDWPFHGLLPCHTGFSKNERSRRGPFRLATLTVRSASYTLHNQNWSSPSANSSITLYPKPLILARPHIAPVGVFLDGDQLFFRGLTGETIDAAEKLPTVTLPDQAIFGLKSVRLADNRTGIVALVNSPNRAYQSCQLCLVIPGESKAAWTISREINTMDLAAGATKSPFPMIVDLDRDGVDEILFPNATQNTVSTPHLECLDSSNGHVRWRTGPILSYSQVIDHCIMLPDSDGDGVNELALVNPVILHPTDETSDLPVLQVTVDIISGRTGKTLGYRSETVSAEGVPNQVVEVDDVHYQDGKLVCSVVWGDSIEVELSSATFEIDLAERNNTQVERGLTVIDSTWESKHSTNLAGRWYRKRSGPYAASSDRAVWYPHQPPITRYANQTLGVDWTNNGNPRVLKGNAWVVDCIDPRNGDILWNADTKWLLDKTKLVRRPSGTVELILQNNTHAHSFPTIVDGETGRRQFEIDELALGEIRQAHAAGHDGTENWYLLAEAPHQPGTSYINRKGYVLCALDRISKRVVWSRPLYNELENKPHLYPATLLILDVDNDGIDEIITGDTSGGLLRWLCLDSRDGAIKWDAPMKASSDGNAWPWSVPWPMAQPIGIGNQVGLAYLDSLFNQPNGAVVNCIDAATGKTLNASPIDLSQRLGQDLRGSVMHDRLMLLPITNDGIPNQLTLVYRERPTFQRKAVLLELDAGRRLQERNAFDVKSQFLYYDANGDATLDLIDLEQTTIRIRDAINGDILRTFEVAANGRNLGVDQVSEARYLRIANIEGKIEWIDLHTGTLAYRSELLLMERNSQNAETRFLFPNGGGETLVATEPGGVILAQNPISKSSTSSAASDTPELDCQPHADDPRYRRELKAFGIFANQSIVDLGQKALLALVALVLPAAILLRMLRNRRWSLKTLMLLPLVAAMVLFGWSQLLADPSGRYLDHLAIGTSVTMCLIGNVWILLRQRRRSIMATALAALILSPFFVAAAHSQVSVYGLPMNSVWTLENVLWSALAIFTQCAGLIYLFSPIIDFQQKRRRNVAALA
ncbi:serine/threonine protein kinase [Rhodopirellula sp. MGV]|uniref:serine/threonine protein kinase n=1 Tax=Rhodopirellula sp. MGV TaxID=2023130 RepID=UPI000B9785A2|nr:serine/threonine-protein kinase [Rhodopirellula sp. MGV]OYP31665.1 hypothetical protein CGZ80_20865 [Rhodopirellula sp. MGV]PNY33974.1 serine/threonine protein kinase [Rhodopirellula baltica]